MTMLDRANALIGDLGIKAPCRAATTGVCNLYGEQTIDGVACVENDRVLVWQNGDLTNGIYCVTTLGWTREPDFNSINNAVQGTMIYVTQGTTYANKLFIVTTANPFVIGEDEVNFAFNTLIPGNTFIFTNP